MGIGSSSESNVGRTYEDIIGITGGSVGGLEDTIAYGGSVLSSKKQQYIKKVAKFVSKDLKFGNAIPNVDSSSPEDLIKAVFKALPDPRDKQSFAKKVKLHQDRCKKLAKFLNELHGREVINVNSSAGDICRDSAVLLRGMMSATTSEIETIHVDLERVINNLNTLGQFQDSAYAKLVATLTKAGDAKSLAVLPKYERIYQLLKTKRELYLSTLAGMTDSILQTQQIDINRLVEEARFFESSIDDIGDAGTSDFAKNMAYSFLNLATTADAIVQVDKSLKKIGMSFAKYKSIEDLADLNNELEELQMSGLTSASEKEIAAFIKSAEILKKHQYMHDEIVKGLSKQGKCEVSGGKDLDKRVAARAKTADALLNAFNSRLDSLLKETLRVATNIGEAVYKGQCPIGDDLMKFVKMVELIPDLQERRQYFSITGYYDDIASRQMRESFISILQHVVTSSEKLYKCKASAHFKEFAGVLNQICDLIELYVDKFAQGFGPMESWEEFTKKDTTGADEPTDELIDMVEGGAGKKVLILTMAQTLQSAINKIRYYYRIQMQKINMAATAKEMKAFSADYKKVMGIAIADTLDKIQGKEDEEMEKFKEESPVDVTDFAQLKDNKYYQALVDKITAAGYERNLSDEDKKLQLKQLKGIRKYVLDRLAAKRNLYRTAEAIDTYLMVFTDAITSNPESLQDIVAIMGATEMISQPFDKESGDSLCRVFECFPGFKTTDNYIDLVLNDGYGKFDDSTNKKYTVPLKKTVSFYSGLGDTDFKTKHYYEVLAAYCRLGNYDKDKVKDILPEDLVTHINARTWNKLQDYDKFENELGKDFGMPIFTANNIEKVAVTTNNISLPGNPFLTTPICADGYEGKTILDAIEETKNVLNAGLVKNLVSVFISIGGEFGNVDLIKKTSMSPKQIYTNICDYITYSSFGFGLKNTAAGTGATYTTDYELKFIGHTKDAISDSYDKLFNNNSIDLVTKDVIDDSNNFAEATMRGVGNIKSTMEAHIEDIFEKSDKIFIMIVKSMMAKVLTAIGAYKMYNKPLQESGLGYNHELRTILGAADKVPKVIPEAMDLYIRMIPMVEQYRDIFSFDNIDQDYRNIQKPHTISMVPEMTGMFSGLIRIIFDKSKNVKDGNYSANEVKALVDEINKIYSHFKSGPNPITSACLELRDEVNRRYGIIKEEEREIYKKARNANRRMPGDSKTTDRILDYELGSIDENDTYRRNAPSDAYRKKFSTATASSKPEYTIDLEQRAQVQYLREKITKLYDNAAIKLLDNSGKDTKTKMDKVRLYSLETLIRTKQKEVSEEPDAEKQFNIVLDAINSMSGFSSHTLESSYLLFHETVVFGLNSVWLLYKGAKNIYNEIRAIVIIAEANPQDPDVFEYLTELIQKLTNHPLIDIKIDTHGYDIKIMVDTGKLRDIAHSLINSIKQQIDLFRPVLEKKFIDKYENYNDNENVITLYGLERRLLDELIEGRYKKGEETDTNGNKYLPFDSIGEELRKMLVTLKNEDVDKYNAIYKELFVLNVGTIVTGTLFAEDDKSINKILFTQFDMKDEKSTTPPALKNATLTLRKKDTGSLIGQFNNNLYEYLNTCFDHVTNTMYYESINELVSGSLNNVIFNDAATNNDGAGNHMVDDPNSILYKSNSVILQRLYSSKVKVTNDYFFLKQDISDIPLYLKERVVVNIEIFREKFLHIMHMANVYQQFIPVYITGADKTKGLNLSAELIKACLSVIKCIDNTLADFSYTSCYGETQKDHFDDYKLLNGDLPFTPLSNVLFKHATNLYPNKSVGDLQFKYMHYVRNIDKFELEDSPGVKKIVDDHNRMVSSEFAFDVDTLNKYYKKLLVLTHIYYGTTVGFDAIMQKVPVGVEDAKDKHIVYALNPDVLTNDRLTNIITMSESTAQKNERKKVFDSLCANAQGTLDRELLKIFNFIDLNIVPINVHALMREIPLINLYNYSYTYDKMIKKLFSVEEPDNVYDNTGTIHLEDASKKRTYNVMGELLMYPDRDMSATAYEFYIPKMMRGAMGIDGYGRPKFLADEVYNKSLLGEIYGENAQTRFMDSPQEDNKFNKMEKYDENSVKNTPIYLKLSKDVIDIYNKLILNVNNNGKSNVSYMVSLLILSELHSNTSIIINSDATGIDTSITKLFAEMGTFLDMYKYPKPITDRTANIAHLNTVIQNINDDNLSSIPYFPKTVEYIETNITGDISNPTDIKTCINNNEQTLQTLFNEEVSDTKTLFINLLNRMTNLLSNVQSNSVVERFRVNNPEYLTYYDKDNLHKVSVVSPNDDGTVGGNQSAKDILKCYGKMRFDTKLVRNLFFLTNNIRMLRHTLNKELMYHEDKIVTQHALLSTKNIEMFGHPFNN